MSLTGPGRALGGRARLVLAVIAACAALPAAASAAPPSEHDLRAFEERSLGPHHAAEHAAVRREERRTEGRALATAGEPGGSVSASSAEVGEWSTAKVPLKVIAIHAALLPTGKVMIWGYPWQPDESVPRVNQPDAWIWDPAKTGDAAWENANPPPDPANGNRPAAIFCAGQSFLADGRMLVTGGNVRFPVGGQGWQGLNEAYTFDPFETDATKRWTRQPDLARGRWYPSQLLLGDGQTAIVGGWDESGNDVENPDLELFTPGSGALGTITKKSSGTRDWPGLYPLMFGLPNGDAFLANRESGDTAMLDTSAFTWRETGKTLRARPGATGVLMPGPSTGSWNVMEIGGTGDADGTGHHPPLKTTEKVDLSQMTATADPAWQAAGSLNVGRTRHNTVLLPDGGMASVGGAAGESPLEGRYTVGDGSTKRVELWDPATGTWKLGPAQDEPRAYHSTALLLPDGRVMSAGDDRSGSRASDTAEIYSPPYLFKGERPAIASAPAAAPWNATFGVASPDDDATRAVLMAPGAVTHGTDMTQRHVELSIAERLPGQGVNVVAPPSSSVAPPGWYMLFLLDDQGVPSVARWIRLGADAEDPADLRAPDPDPPTDPGPGPDPDPGPKPATGGAEKPAPEKPPAEGTEPAADTRRPSLAVRLGRPSRARLLRSGRLVVRASMNEAATLSLTARLAGGESAASPTLARRKLFVPKAGRRTHVLKLSRRGRRALRRRPSARLTLAVSARDRAGNERRRRLAVTLR